jgi:hypothetical protein
MTDPKIQSILEFLPHDKLQTVLEIRRIMLASSINITETVKWGRVTFATGKDPVAFICSKRDADYIELGFFKAASLSDPGQLFRGKGKEIRRIKIRSMNEIPAAQVRRWIKEAVKLNTK